MTSVVIRRATAADAESLASVAAVTFPLACPPGSTREAQDAFIAVHLSEPRFAEYLVDPQRVLFVAEEGGELVGYTMVVFGEPHDADAAAAITLRPAAELSKCYVLPGHHGAGVSARLMEASIDAAREAGAAGMWLGVNEENERAQRFYAKSGFERVGVKHFLVGEVLEDDYVYERALAPEAATR
ncbi:GNAT family N-acetyltransferase [Humibacter ginsenosidimutans]|uniref:GNAT family N-acetyltransferase n=1 Tax=Humibacter ginsenosidimutans TaxID=2599293 RepID=A0A5B8M6X8_9MICO|nr:GNAT family N-acetyltransferase [Humibacter ginsenosidimutans]QDZ16163.1 GNAT family N-acetyltransferase [Humibacter ginsenosidimutans]